VQEVTHSALQQERAALREVMERADRASTALATSQMESAHLADQLEALARERDELRQEAAQRGAEVVALRAELQTLTRNYDEACAALAAERAAAADQAARLKAEASAVRDGLSGVAAARDEAAAQARDHAARSAQLLVENGRLKQSLEAAQRDVAQLRQGKSLLQQNMLAQVAALRGQVAAEYAGKSAGQPAAAHGAAQRAAAAMASHADARAASSGGAAGGPASAGSGGSAADVAAALVRDTLRAAGLQADGAAGGAGSPDHSFADTAARGFAGERSPSRNYVDIPGRTDIPVGRGLGQDRWQSSLRSVSDRPAAAGAAPPVPPNGVAGVAALESPGTAALHAAKQKARARRGDSSGAGVDAGGTGEDRMQPSVAGSVRAPGGRVRTAAASERRGRQPQRRHASQPQQATVAAAAAATLSSRHSTAVGERVDAGLSAGAANVTSRMAARPASLAAAWAAAHAGSPGSAPASGREEAGANVEAVEADSLGGGSNASPRAQPPPPLQPSLLAGEARSGDGGSSGSAPHVRHSLAWQQC
jgi:hypothetical protein